MSHAEEKLRELLTSIVEEKYPQASDVKVKAIATGGANYSSALYEATIVTPEENVELFAKICNMGETFNNEGKYVFATEKYIYTGIASAYNKIQDNHGLTDNRFVFPKYFKSSSVNDKAQILVMENLVTKGYSCYGRFECIDFKYASNCIETLAKYHALSLALKKEDPDEFKRAEKLQLPLVDSVWSGLTDAALTAVDEVDREKLAKLFEGPEGWAKMKELGDARKTGVIIHGDYRPSNLMHKETDGEFHVIPVDYQTTRVGCPAADLLYFLLLGTDQQFRQQHFHELVGYYYQQLALAMTRLSLVPEEVYGREEFDSDMKEKLPLGLCTAALVLPFVLVEAAHAPSFEEGKYVPRSNELFAKRFRELVHDFNQWGYF